MKEYKAGAAGGPGAGVPETGASKPGPAGGQGGSLWRTSIVGGGNGRCKGPEAGLRAHKPRGQASWPGQRWVRPACRPPRGSAAPSGEDGSQGQGEHSRAVTPSGRGLLAAGGGWVGGGWARGGCGQDAGGGLGQASALGQPPLDSPPPRHLPAPQPRQVLAQKALPAPPPGKALPSGKRRSETANPTITDKMDSSP